MAFRLIACAVFFMANIATAQDTQRSVTVTGTGTVTTAPDLAMVTLGVTIRKRTARDALQHSSIAMTEVMDVVGAAGIEPRDVQTSQLTLNPAWERYGNGREAQIVGYDASNMVIVRVRDMDSLGSLLDDLSIAGANRIQSIQFGVDQSAEFLAAARRAAIADAVAKADLYASGAGATLGAVLTINEFQSGGHPQPMGRIAMESAAMDVPVAGGELSIRAEISVTFALE